MSYSNQYTYLLENFHAVQGSGHQREPDKLSRTKCLPPLLFREWKDGFNFYFRLSGFIRNAIRF